MRINFTLLLVSLMLTSSHLFAKMESDTSEYQFLVSFEANTSEDSILAYLEDINAEEVWELDDVDIALWQVDHFPFTAGDGEVIYDIQGLIRRTRLRTRIKSADYDFETSLPDGDDATVSTDCFDPALFQVATGTEEVKISILDSGISDISDNTTPEYNYNLTSYTGYDYVNNDEIPEDENGHGSHVAGIIHSIVKHNPATNVTFDIRKTHDAQGKAMMSDIILAMYEAIEEDADIINLSFGALQDFSVDTYYPLRTLIQEAEDEDILVVAAAGNNGSDNDNLSSTMLPASFPEENIVSVAASDCSMNLAPFSNYGAETVDVLTYGIEIPGPDLGTGLSYVSGTSQSTAIVSAVAALIATNDVEDYDEIKCQLTNVGAPINALNGSIECPEDRTVAHEVQGISVYPTIVADATVNVEGKEINSIEVYNSLGQKVHSKALSASENNVSISTSGWNKGVYYVHINNTHSVRIVLPF